MNRHSFAQVFSLAVTVVPLLGACTIRMRHNPPAHAAQPVAAQPVQPAQPAPPPPPRGGGWRADAPPPPPPAPPPAQPVAAPPPPPARAVAPPPPPPPAHVPPGQIRREQVHERNEQRKAEHQ